MSAKKKLDEIDRELLKLKLKNPAITYSEMGEAVSLGLSQIWKRISNETFQDALEYHQMKPIEIIARAKQKAAMRYEQLIDSKIDSVAQRTCESFLADVLPAKKQEIKHLIDNSKDMTDEQIEKKIEEILHGAKINSGLDTAIAELLSKTQPRDPGRDKA